MAAAVGPGGLPVGVLTLEVTHRCHRRCAFCYALPAKGRARAAEPGRELPAVELGRLALDVARRSGCDHVQLSGGEPLLARDLEALIELLRAAGLRVSLLSDGMHLDPARARALADRGVSVFQPTLLAARAEVHDALRGPGAFADATRAIATAAGAGLRVSACMVITRRNWRGAADVARLAFALGAETLALSRFTPAGEAAAAWAELMPTAAEVRTAAEEAADACAALGLRVAAAVTVPACVWRDPQRPPLPVGVCSLLGARTTATIAPDGGVRSCSLSREVVGNLREEPWDVLADRLWRRHLEPLRRGADAACPDCAHRTRCHGGCRLAALSIGGSIDAPDPLAPRCASDTV